MRIGIDLGGSKIEAIALAEDGSERFRRRIATPQDDYAGTIEAIADLVGEIQRETDQLAGEPDERTRPADG